MIETQFTTFWQAVRITADRVTILEIAQTLEEAVALAAAHPGAVAVFRPVRPVRVPERFRGDDF